MRLFGAVTVMLGACSFPDFAPDSIALSLAVEEAGPFAVGSTTQIRVLASQCTGLFRPPDGICTAPPEDVLDHRLEPAGAFELTRTDAEFDVTAIAEGNAGFFVDVISRGQRIELGYNLVAKAIDAVALDTLCESPALMPTGLSTALTYRVLHGDDQLSGRIMPLTVAGAQLLPPDEHDIPWLRLPTSPGTVTITSPYVPSFLHQIDVVSPVSIDGVALTEPEWPLVAGSITELSLDLLVGTRVMCGGSQPITTTISTPDRCALDPGYGTFSDTIRVHGLAAGDCTVHVTLDGTALSATKTFPVK